MTSLKREKVSVTIQRRDLTLTHPILELPLEVIVIITITEAPEEVIEPDTKGEVTEEMTEETTEEDTEGTEVAEVEEVTNPETSQERMNMNLDKDKTVKRFI